MNNLWQHLPTYIFAGIRRCESKLCTITTTGYKLNPKLQIKEKEKQISLVHIIKHLTRISNDIKK